MTRQIHIMMLLTQKKRNCCTCRTDRKIKRADLLAIYKEEYQKYMDQTNAKFGQKDFDHLNVV